MKNIILFGLKNSGKTTIGKILSLKLNYNFIDTDILLEKFHTDKKNSSYKEIYRDFGETYFRKLEEEVLLSLKKDSRSIISLGGGAAGNISNHPTLEQLGQLIYLKIEFETFFQRLKKDCLSNENCFFLGKVKSEKELKELYENRTKLFSLLPSHKISVDTLLENQIVEEIINVIK